MDKLAGPNRAVLDSVSSFVDQGRFQEAYRGLKSLLTSSFLRRVSSNDLTLMAGLLRRMDRSQEALRLLLPTVRGRGRRLAPDLNRVPSEIKVEYAQNLIQLRLIREARELLSRVELNDHPQAQVSIGISYLHAREYAKAEQQLARALTRHRKKLGDYPAHVVEVNLLLARANQAADSKLMAEIRRLRNACVGKKYLLLADALIAIGARVSYLTQSDQRSWLKLLHDHRPVQTYPRLVAQLFEQLLRHQVGDLTTAELAARLQALRAEADQAQAFEIVREMDLIRPPDLLVETRVKMGDSLAPKLMRLLQVLAQEKYVPLNDGAIWDLLMAPSHYLGRSSRDAIYQWLKRLRAALVAQKIPARVIWDRSGYRLKWQKPGFELEFPSHSATTSTTDHRHRYLQWYAEVSRLMKGVTTGGGSERVKLQTRTLKIQLSSYPVRTHQLFLKIAVERGHLHREGVGRKTWYRLHEVPILSAFQSH